ncbi:MAG: hypothetical protein MRY83_25155, partial [Flavobacteriales bacterium]|nr:hypothetical protein [Flavobacteriales bacterium]
MIRTFNISTIVLGLLCVFFTTNKVVAQIPCVPGSSYSLCQYLGISSVDSTRDFQVQQTDFLHPSGVGARVGILGQLGPDTIFFAVKKTSGPIDWVKTYTGIGNIKAHRFISTSTTVYIVSYDNTNDWQLGDVHIMAVDINNGNINWSKTVGTVAQDYYPQIFRYYDNNVTAYRLAVLFRSKLTQHTENLTYVQLDQSGTVLYSQQYDVEGNEITRDVSMYYDGSLPFAAGVSFGFVGKRLDTDKGFLATLTADGTAQNAIQIEYGGAFFEARELQPHYNFQPPCYSVFSGFVISGEVPYNLPNTYWRSLIKLDPSKKVAWYRDYDNLDIDFSLIDSTRNYFYQKSSTGT